MWPTRSTCAIALDDSNFYFYPIESPGTQGQPRAIRTKLALYDCAASNESYGWRPANDTSWTEGFGQDSNVGINWFGNGFVEVDTFSRYGASYNPMYIDNGLPATGEFSVGVTSNGFLVAPVSNVQVIHASDQQSELWPNGKPYMYYVNSITGKYASIAIENGIYQDTNNYFNGVQSGIPTSPTNVWEHNTDGTIERHWYIGNGNNDPTPGARMKVTGNYSKGKFNVGVQLPPTGTVEWYQATNENGDWYYYCTNLAGQYKAIKMATGVWIHPQSQQPVAWGLSSDVNEPKILKTYDTKGNYKRILYSTAVNGSTPVVANAGEHRAGKAHTDGNLLLPVSPNYEIMTVENPKDPAYPKIVRWYELTPQYVTLKNNIIGNQVYYKGTLVTAIQTINSPYIMTTVTTTGSVTKAYRQIGPTPNLCIEISYV